MQRIILNIKKRQNYLVIIINITMVFLLYSVQRENTMILRIPSRHHAIETGSPMTECCLGGTSFQQWGLPLNRVYI